MPKRKRVIEKIIFDFKDLKLRITKVFDTQAAFADAMGMDLTSVNQRLNNVVDWRPSEIHKACMVLDIPLVDIPVYFFTAKV